MSVFSAISRKTSGPPSSATVPALVSIALYIAAAAVQISGLAVVAYQVGEQSFTLFTIGMTLLGTTMSYFLRRRGTGADILKLGGAALAVVFFYVWRRSSLFELLVPSQGSLTNEVVLVCALALTATFGSFLLVTDDALVFTCVWTIAMIGLTGTVNINKELPICFILFLFSAAFLLVHQNALRLASNRTSMPRNSQGDTGGGNLAGQLRLLRAHLFTAFAAWGVALILGSLIAIPLQMVGRNLSLATILQRLRAPLTNVAHNSGPPRLSFNSLKQFSVGLGPIEDDETPQLTVLANDRYDWRGRTFSEYNGHGWENGERLRDRDIEPDDRTPDASDFYTYTIPAEESAPDSAPGAHSKHIVADFQSLIGGIGPLYSASEPVKVRAPTPAMVLFRDRTMASALTEAAVYQVESDVPTKTMGDLRSASHDFSAEVRLRYLNPGPGNAAVEELAREAVVGVADDELDRANAIKRFISARCSYSPEARAVPPDRDAVDFFLNDTHEGYCDLYASAMVVLCRYDGIPARMATGYDGGTAIADDGQYAPPTSKGDNRHRYLMRGNDLHAWAEVYFPHFGWVVFDATEDTGMVALGGQAHQDEKKKGNLLLFRREMLPMLLAGVAVLLGVGTLVNELRLRLLRRGSRGGTWRSHGRARAATRAYRSALGLLRRRGVGRSATMSGGEYVRAVEAKFGAETAAALRRLTEIENIVLYADPSTPPEGLQNSDSAAALRDLRTALKNSPKAP